MVAYPFRYDMTQIPAFSVRTERPADDLLTLVVEGELDLASVELLEQYTERALEAGVPATVVLDLAGCDFIDSSGIGLLLRQQDMLEDRGAALVVAGCGRAVQRSLSLTGVDAQLRLADDVQAAIAATRAPRDT